jgi:hypothetical protein
VSIIRRKKAYNNVTVLHVFIITSQGKADFVNCTSTPFDCPNHYINGFDVVKWGIYPARDRRWRCSAGQAYMKGSGGAVLA